MLRFGMDVRELQHRLRANGAAITALVEASESECRWKPAPDRWSLVEIVNHLASEESIDFRQRLRLIAEDTALDWPPFDLFTAAQDGTWAAMDYTESVERWKRERAESLTWLADAGEIDPEIRYAGRGSDKHPLSAGDLMSSWVAHDFFHIRQIVRLRWDYLASDETPHAPEYAGVE